MDFSWNLGIASNNMVEAYVLYQGLLLMEVDQINQITIVGDSKNTIQYFIKGSSPKDIKIKRIIERIRLLLTNIPAKFFHILRENNQEADKLVNKEINMALGSLRVQGQVNFVAPPNGRGYNKEWGPTGP
jgi:ribonuclease HI